MQGLVSEAEQQMAQEGELRNVMRVMDGGGRGRNPDAVPRKMPEIPLTPREVPPLLCPQTVGAQRHHGTRAQSPDESTG